MLVQQYQLFRYDLPFFFVELFNRTINIYLSPVLWTFYYSVRAKRISTLFDIDVYSERKISRQSTSEAYVDFTERKNRPTTP